MTTRKQTWEKLLKKVIEDGHDHHKDDSRIREIIGVHEFIPNLFVDAGLGISVDYVTAVDWISKGFADIPDYPMKGEALADYVSSITNLYMIDGGDFVYTYPERLFNYQSLDLFDEKLIIDQVEVMISRLRENPGSNRGVSVLYNPGRDAVAEDIPCLNWLQCLIRDNELILSVMFRSNDLYGAWPSNMLFLTCLGIRIVDLLKEDYPGLVFEGIDYHCSSLHVYETDMTAAKKAIGIVEE